MKRRLEEESKQRSVRVKEIEGEVEKFVLSQEKEFSFKSTEKEWRAIQGGFHRYFWTLLDTLGHPLLDIFRVSINDGVQKCPKVAKSVQK